MEIIKNGTQSIVTGSSDKNNHNTVIIKIVIIKSEKNETWNGNLNKKWKKWQK